MFLSVKKPDVHNQKMEKVPEHVKKQKSEKLLLPGTVVL